MVVNQNQPGFTLIEITLVMAISAILLATILVGQAQVRERAQFSDAVNHVATEINEVRNEAQTTVELGDPATIGTTDSGETFFGKLMEFDPASSSIQVSDMLQDGTSITLANPSTISIPWQVDTNTGLPGPEYLIFHLSSTDAQLLVYTPPAGTSLTGTLENTSWYDETPGNSELGTLVLPISDPEGHNANITINGAAGGAVTVAFQ